LPPNRSAKSPASDSTRRSRIRTPSGSLEGIKRSSPGGYSPACGSGIEGEGEIATRLFAENKSDDPPSSWEGKMVLIQDFDAQPEAEVEGVHFQIKASSGETIRCSIDPDVFKERLTIDSDANRSGYFSTHFGQVFRHRKKQI
jgi:hypothetical protein